jgi:hypothetical protein
MKCSTCGQGPPRWTQESEGTYRLQANWLDERTLQEIAEHALAAELPSGAISIDVCQVTLSDCEECTLRHLRTDRDRVEREYGLRGLKIHYFY